LRKTSSTPAENQESKSTLKSQLDRKGSGTGMSAGGEKARKAVSF